MARAPVAGVPVLAPVVSDGRCCGLSTRLTLWSKQPEVSPEISAKSPMKVVHAEPVATVRGVILSAFQPPSQVLSIVQLPTGPVGGVPL
jgi:hypothetical protein